jgi:biotin transport system substrate-specific component
MTSLTVPTFPALADAVVPRSLLANAALVVGGAAFTGLLAQVAVPLWPVPITGQTLAVLLVGSSLGMARGTLAMVLYAVLGVVGVPWFSGWTSGPGVALGPTGGYILGFILAAALTGWLAERGGDRAIVRAGATFLLGTVSVFAVGLPWLAISLGLDFEQTLQFGLYPFIIGGIVKAAIAAAALPIAWRALARRDARRRPSQE